MSNHKPFLLLFVDGLGLGCSDPLVNPIKLGFSPTLDRLMSNASGIDPTMGIAGLPQSATGQTALLTGLNSAKILGRHLEGFPNLKLREIISNNCIFNSLKKIGIKSTFANAYYINPEDNPNDLRPKSATTVAALSSFGDVRRIPEMESGEAVYHDLTRESLRKRGYKGSLISPKTAAEHLEKITESNDFTLFEYFLTDRAGHSCDPNFIKKTLIDLDSFIESLALNALKGKFTLLITSDHGNIEDSTTSKHTINPVPFIILGEYKNIPFPREITEIANFILKQFQ